MVETDGGRVAPCMPVSASFPIASGPRRQGLSKSEAVSRCAAAPVTALSDHKASFMPPHSWASVRNCFSTPNALTRPPT